MSTSTEAPQLPPHLAQRLDEDQALFAKSSSAESLAADQATVSARHDAILSAKSTQGRDEVEHAKAVAAAVHHHESGIAEQLKPLEDSVQAKRDAVDSKQAELGALEAQLREAAAKEERLKQLLADAEAKGIA